jgi:hypothetical protein
MATLNDMATSDLTGRVEWIDWKIQAIENTMPNNRGAYRRGQEDMLSRLTFERNLIQTELRRRQCGVA